MGKPDQNHEDRSRGSEEPTEIGHAPPKGVGRGAPRLDLLAKPQVMKAKIRGSAMPKVTLSWL